MLSGFFRVLHLYDVAEEIALDQVRRMVPAQPPVREPSFKHPAPDYVRFERPPVIEPGETIQLSTGERFQARLKYFDYGVVSVELEAPFTADWEQLVRLSSQWIASVELEQKALALVQTRTQRVQKAFRQPYSQWLSEDYAIIHIEHANDASGRPYTADELIAEYGDYISRIVRGDSAALAPPEAAEALQSRLSYYPHDLIVAGWVAALVVDTAEAAIPAIQLLEYANTQLLEFRYYDERLTTVLAQVYKTLERRGGFLRRWRLAREADRLNAMRLDVIELTERTDNAIKFLSDMFYARAYRIAAARVGVADYRNLVEQKLKTAGDLYEFMTNEFHQARAFFLEVLVVIILIIDLITLFRGK